MFVGKLPQNAPREIPAVAVQKLESLGNREIQFHSVVRHGNHFRIRFDLVDRLGRKKHGEVSRRRIRLVLHKPDLTVEELYQKIQQKSGVKIFISPQHHLAE